MDDMYIGRFLDERYEIREKIGSGGMAVVYKALDHRLNRFVAIKILKADLAQDPELRRRFHAESQAVAMLSHPNIVSVYDVNHSENVDYIVMELIEGITLKQYINRKGILNWKEALHFTTQIAKALEHAHSRGIIHRDIKPHNIMILKDGNVKVADFGIARLLTTQNTLTQQTLGSVHYISPEQAKGSAVDARSDIYSLGVVMYEMLTSRLPFEGESAVSIAVQHISSIPLEPREINPDIPVGLEEITMKAMSPNLSARYQSATELLEDLEDFRKNPSIRFNYSIVPSMADDPDSTKQIIPVKNVSEIERARRRVSGNGATRNRVTPEEYRKNRSKSGRTTMLVGTFCVAVLLVLLVAFMWDVAIKDWLMPESEQRIDVLNFVGMMLDQLDQQKEEYIYYSFKVNYDKNSDKPEGYIIKQEPAAGRSVSLTDSVVQVTLTVSAGQEVIPMPDIINMDYRLAQNELKNGEKYKDLTLNITLAEQSSDDVTAGFVIDTSPKEGDALSPGMSVVIIYSTGPDVTYVKVPNLINATESRAKSLLEAARLQGRMVEEYDDTTPKGRVSFQNYQPETEVPIGTVVDYYVSLGPAPTTTPNNPGNTEQPGGTDVPGTDEPGGNDPGTQPPEGGGNTPGGDTPGGDIPGGDEPDTQTPGEGPDAPGNTGEDTPGEGGDTPETGGDQQGIGNDDSIEPNG